MTWPQPTGEAHETFCRKEKWARVRDARGRAGTHHLTYELTLQDGRILRTRISHPPDRTSYGPRIWSHILRDQLEVSEPGFWACVRDGILPDRGEAVVPTDALPVDLVYALINRVGLCEAEVAAMTTSEAIARMQRYWTEGT